MKKETAVAVLIGLTLGLIITYGVYNARLALTKKPAHNKQTAAIQNDTITPTSENNQLITLHNPQDGTVQIEKKTTVTGTSTPLQQLVLFVNNTSYIRQSDDAGNFSFEVPLTVGSNILTLTTSDSENRIISVERTVIVADLSEPAATASPSPTPKAQKASAKATPSPTPTPTPEVAASDSTASALKGYIEKSLQKEALNDAVAAAQGKITGFVGEVTRIAQNTISVKHADTTTILKVSDAVILKKKDKAIKLTDISIADWAVVVGEMTDETFAPKLILVSATSLRPTPKLVTFATISEIKKQQMILIPRDTSQGETITVTISKQTKFESVDGSPLKLSDIEKDYTVLAIAEKQDPDDGEYTLTTVRSLASEVKK